MSEPVIELRNISKNYGKKKVLKDVSFTVNKGDIYGVVGKNGAGKTTLFKLILGLSPYNGGTILLEGSDDLDTVRSKMGFFIGNNFFPYLTARENLIYYADLKGMKDRSEIDKILELVGLKDVKTKVGGFSLGMKQRLGIGMAIIGRPEILILDEPANGLDPQGIADIRKLIRHLNSEYGMTIIVSSHILGELQNTAHRFGIVNNGTIIRELSEADLQLTDESIALSISTADAERAKELLRQNGIEILAEKAETKSLEDYYFQLIGGGEEAESGPGKGAGAAGGARKVKAGQRADNVNGPKTDPETGSGAGGEKA